VIPPEHSGDFVAAMEDVLDVYKRPYNPKFPVVCMDETPRCGTFNVFMANEPLAGTRYVKVTARKTKPDWAEFLREVADRYANAKQITLVMDNLNTHKPGALYEAFAPAEAKRLRDRFAFVYTPKHGSWLNMAEIELNVLIAQCLNQRMESLEQVMAAVLAWQARRDNRKAKINWQFTTEDARVKLHRLYPTEYV
jgi:hypothetical protein